MYKNHEIIDRNGNVVKENLYHADGLIMDMSFIKDVRTVKCPITYWNFGEEPYVTSDGYEWIPEGFNQDKIDYGHYLQGLFVNGLIYQYKRDNNHKDGKVTLTVYAPNGEIHKQIEEDFDFEPSENIEDLDLLDDEFMDF